MSWKRIRKLLGMLLVIHGALAFGLPQSYLPLIQSGSPTVDDMLDYLAHNPALARRIAAAELATGLWLIVR